MTKLAIMGIVAKRTTRQVLKTVYIMVILTIGLVWLNQDALSRFWQQTYHNESPWTSIEQPIWNLGGRLTQATIVAKKAFTYSLLEQTEPHYEFNQAHDYSQDNDINENEQSDDVAEVHLDPVKKSVSSDIEQTAIKIAKEANTKPKIALLDYLMTITKSPTEHSDIPLMLRASMSEDDINHMASKKYYSNRVIPGEPIMLKEKDVVFFAGDSMMQGIAPHAMRSLRKKYGIKGIDLSKQSTGLSYPKFFDWPATIKKTLQENPDIKLMVVFMGPNDPWDMPPAKGGKYLKFMSDDWEALYRQRIKMILENARDANVQVIWIGPPNMRREKLSQGVNFINTLYKSEVEAAQQLYISVNEIFSYNEDSYSDYKTVEGRQVKVRSGDGTHFSGLGQRMISDHLLTFIDADIPEEVVSEESKK